MNGGEIVLATLAGVALLGRLFFGKGLLWVPVKLVRGLVILAVSSVLSGSMVKILRNRCVKPTNVHRLAA